MSEIRWWEVGSRRRGATLCLRGTCLLALLLGAACESGRSRSDEVEVASLRYPVTAPASTKLVLRSAGAGYEVEVTSPQGFAPRAADPALKIGSRVFDGERRYPPSGSLYTLIFTISAAEFDSVASGDQVSVVYGLSRSGIDIGVLDKSSVGVQ
jgi:hypothetical protein